MGVDIGGARNTWVCTLEGESGCLTLREMPRALTITDILRYAEAQAVVAVAIDAPLTWAPREDDGWRSSDRQLQDHLPKECRRWVRSQNSLMAVPLRGQHLAEYLSPLVGTVIETHPRACLYFANSGTHQCVLHYKPSGTPACLHQLWQVWTDQFSIAAPTPGEGLTDRAIDALVCATVAYLYLQARTASLDYS